MNKNLANVIDANTAETADMQAVWDAAGSPVYRVIDEDGVNVVDCMARRLTAKLWLLVDDTDGYQLIEHEDAERLILVPDDKHVPFGWDARGNVVAL